MYSIWFRLGNAQMDVANIRGENGGDVLSHMELGYKGEVERLTLAASQERYKPEHATKLTETSWLGL